MFSNQRDSILGLLILRHLHDGDAIDWPVPDRLPQAHIFRTLEQNGYIARWDRIWPLHDRYRLTQKGAQALQSLYRPGSGEAVIKQLRARNLAPSARQQALRAMGADPAIWCILHDPQTHWSTWPETIGPYQRYIWEPEVPNQVAQPQQGPRPAGGASGPRPASGGSPRPASGGSPRPASGGGGPRPVQPAQAAQPAYYQPSGFEPGYDVSFGHHHHHHHHGHGGQFDPSSTPDTSGPEFTGGGGGESGGGGSSGGWDTDNLDQGGGSGSTSGGSSYGDVS